MVERILFSPPVAFTILILAMVILSRLFSPFAFHGQKPTSGAKKGYACGEDFKEHMIQPDYSQFFPFAFFFTILHVVALIITTAPAGSIGAFTMAAVYVAGATTGLIILLRKEI